MFVDDLALLADTPGNLEAALDMLQMYCEKWSLTVNMKKTKVLVFGQAGQRAVIWYYNGNPLEQVTSNRYLGIIFHQNGLFNEATGGSEQEFIKYCEHDIRHV